MQELFLYLSTNNFGKFHDSAFWRILCRTFLFYRILGEFSIWGEVARVRNDIPCLSLRFQGRGSSKIIICTSPPLKSRYRQGISFLTQVFPELEKSFRTGDIISCLGYPLPEGEIRDIEMVGLQQIAKRHVCYSVKKEFRYRRKYLEKYRPR